MLLPAWARLLWRNQFAVHPTKLPMAFMISLVSIANSSLSVLQELLLKSRIDRQRIDPPPLFIIGHWRSGTTFLHELLVLDHRHSFPTTYECFCPGHFLLSGEFVSRWCGFFLPSRRPMDNVKTGWRQPQEDEFALANLGACSPYLTMAFPNRPVYQEYLTLTDLTPAEIKAWQDTLQWFLKRVFYRSRQRIVLKSPPHLSRLNVLTKLFPESRFIHIVRDPLDMFPSTVRLWKSLYSVQGLQVPRFDGLEEYVFTTFETMYREFERQRPLIPASHIHDVRYEDLVRDPIGQLQLAYKKLELGEFEPARPKVAEYARSVAKFKRNEHTLSLKRREEVLRRWGPYLAKYGYGREMAESVPSGNNI